jgi:O-antigen ligase
VAEATDLFAHSRPYHSHNLYTEIAAELGGVGFAAFLIGIGALGYWYWRAPPAARAQTGPWAAALFAYLWPIQSQPVLLKVWWFPVVFFLLVGYLAALDAKDDAKQKVRMIASAV